MTKRYEKSEWQRALNCMVGGVNSPVRAFGAVEAEPIVVKQAQGARFEDSSGKQYLDFGASWGPLILGHTHPDVIAAVTEAVTRGLSYGLTSEPEIELAELIVSAIPGVDRVRLVSSGTEATMSALRLARGITGRKLIVKCQGCYHGHSDGLLVEAGSGIATFSLPSTAGVPEEYARLTLTVPFNDSEAAETVFGKYGDDIAALIIEPTAGNMGVVPPRDGYLESLRQLCTDFGTMLIFDEVITGFRLCYGSVKELFKVSPDIITLGKIIGGGMPVGAYAASADIMSHLAPEGEVYQAGTLSGNPVSAAVGAATLRILKQSGASLYSELDTRTVIFAEGVRQAAEMAGVPLQINQCGSMLTLFFTDAPVIDYLTAKRCDTKRYAAFFRSLLAQGIYIPPSQFEAMFISTAHTNADIKETLQAVNIAMKTL